MTKTRLAAALSLALLVAPVSQAAKYKVVELPLETLGQSSFASAINEQGTSVVNVNSPYNIPIDLELINFELATIKDNLTDIDAAKQGNFNIADYNLLLSFIAAGENTQGSQQLANVASYAATANESIRLPGFDGLTAEGDQYVLASNSIVQDINSAGYVVGSSEGPYSKIEYTLKQPPSSDSENTAENDVIFVTRDFGTRGYVSIGETIVHLTPPASLVGGFSNAFGINENNQVVGFGTTSFLTDSIATEIANCESEEIVDDEDDSTVDYLPPRGNVPVESCISNLIDSVTNSTTSFADVRGLIWQLDDQGNVTDTKELGLLFEPEADDTVGYTSQALAINDNGIAVGMSNVLFEDNNFVRRLNYAVIFNGDELINLTKDPERIVKLTAGTVGSANDINNDNLVVGFEVKSVNGSNRKKFFVYDMNTDEMTFPEDFFLGSASEAFDINNNGQIVGFGEIDASLTGRRTEGFIYDHNTQEFNGLQSFLECDSPYSIVQANSINDNGEIAATALYKGPQRDTRGEIILDDNGNQIIVDLVKAVKLEPIAGGEVDSCETVEENEINRDRQGASATWILTLGIFILGWRRFKKAI